jgi:hypothetical protein
MRVASKEERREMIRNVFFSRAAYCFLAFGGSFFSFYSVFTSDAFPFLISHLSHALYLSFSLLSPGMACFERVLCKLTYPNYHGSYILDIGNLDFQATVSASADNSKNPISGKKNRKRQPQRETRAAMGANADAEPWLIAKYGKLTPGLTVLKAAISMMSSFYPETTKRIYFVNSTTSFLLAFKIFSLWVDSRTRAKFTFIGNGYFDNKPEMLLDVIDSDQLYDNFGGTAGVMEKDDFIREYMERETENGTIDCNRN